MRPKKLLSPGTSRFVAETLEPRRLLSAGQISGVVYVDSNANTTRDPGDLGIAGVTVYLQPRGSSSSLSTVTAQDGSYSFSGLAAGQYSISTSPPSNYVQEYDFALTSVTAADGTNTTAPPIGVYSYASVSGLVFNDANGNGLQDAGEEGIGDMFVELENAGPRGPLYTLNGDGTFTFPRLTPGTRTLAVTVNQPGWHYTTPWEATVALASGEAYTAMKFGVAQDNANTGSIAACPFVDRNGDHIPQHGEEITATTIYLDLNNNGIRDAGEPADSTGDPTLYPTDEWVPFTGLKPGTYTVREIPQPNYYSISPIAVTVTVRANHEVQATFDHAVGTHTNSSIAVSTYNDLNGDGSAQRGEPPVAGITVYLDLNDNGIFDSGEPKGLTDATGSYTFAFLHASTYLVRILPTPAWTASKQGTEQNVNLPDELGMGVNFGLVQNVVTGSISGTIFNDANSNGKRDAGEQGIAGAIVEVKGLKFSNAVTDATGTYHYDNLGAFAYTVDLIGSPSGWHATTPTTGQVTVVPGQVKTGPSFGLKKDAILTGSISGQIFNDKNGNGNLDIGEAGMATITAYLDTNNNGNLDTGESSAITSLTGAFSFANVSLGTYHVREVVPTGYRATTTLPVNAVVAAGKTTSVTFGNQSTAGIIAGTIYLDANGNAARDSGEAGMSGVTAYLDINRNGKLDALEPSTITSSAGLFSIAIPPPGTYLVRESIPGGFTLTTPVFVSVVVSAGSGATVAFGNQPAGSISGMIFSDFNADGLLNGSDAGMSNGTVYIDSNNNGTFDVGEKSVKSSNAGAFTFFNLAPGTYTVREIPLPGYRLTTPGVRSVVVTTAPAPAITFGNQRLAGISGTVYNDVNGNSSLDAGDLHLPNVKVFLDTNNNGKLDAGEVWTTSAADGTYSFTNLIPGSSRVAEVVPAGFVTGDPVTGRTDITLYPSTTSIINLGNLKPNRAAVSFSGTVFKDVNLNGTREASEPGLAGWKFYIDLNNNSTFDAGEPSTLSNSAGLFTFTNVKTGRYLVRPLVPAGWRMSHFVAWFATSFGKNVTGLDFAASQTAKISGTAFIDQNQSAALDVGEFHLGGWTVYLDANNNGKLDAGEHSIVTAANGQYTFDGIAAGTHVVRIVQQAGYKLTTPGSYKLTLTSGQGVGNENFGE
ncbi:MAG TPA: SdrD B-like domain-containing protein [Humisphaera sp.]|jgi:uncharacterized protein (DUF2141 family)|nr:SdrD B-like domain-containing protein [Humisphaera sp.]